METTKVISPTRRSPRDHRHDRVPTERVTFEQPPPPLLKQVHDTIRNNHLDRLRSVLYKHKYGWFSSDVYLLHFAAKEGASPDCIELLGAMAVTQGGIDKYNKDSRTALFLACENNHLDTAKKLIDMGARVDAVDLWRNTPLHLAATKNYPQIAKMLLDSGADIEALTEGGTTALHRAARHSLECCKLLIERGARQDIKNDKEKKVAADYASTDEIKQYFKSLNNPNTRTDNSINDNSVLNNSDANNNNANNDDNSSNDNYRNYSNNDENNNNSTFHSPSYNRRSSRHSSTSSSPIGSTKSSPNDSSQKSAKQSSPDVAKTSKGSAKSSPNESVKSSPSGSVRSSPRRSARSSPSGSNKSSPTGSAKSSPSASVKSEPTESNDDPSKLGHKDQSPYSPPLPVKETKRKLKTSAEKPDLKILKRIKVDEEVSFRCNSPSDSPVPSPAPRNPSPAAFPQPPATVKPQPFDIVIPQLPAMARLQSSAMIVHGTMPPPSNYVRSEPGLGSREERFVKAKRSNDTFFWKVRVPMESSYLDLVHAITSKVGFEFANIAEGDVWVMDDDDVKCLANGAELTLMN